jgi:hypothetical protein
MASRVRNRSPWSRPPGDLFSFGVAREILDAVFSVTHRGARARRWVLILLGAILWAVFAFAMHPYRQGADWSRSFWDYPFRALFAADVFRVILLLGLGFWIAYRVASVFLDDVFEIGDLNVAKKFLRQAAFADQYGQIEIANGRVVDNDQQSPIFLIGGPGKVRVNLENAALFERVDGWDRVIPPTVHPRARENLPRDDFAILEEFERLRSVVDLRDHIETMQVHSRTRDGLKVSAEDVRIIFSVFRDNEEPTLARPYPFTEESIRKLVYNQQRMGQGVTHWTTTMTFLISQEMGNFITQHTLDEFLAAVGEPEVNQREEEDAELRESAKRRAGTQALLTGGPPASLQPPDFASRSQLSDLFYGMDAFVETARKQGVKLRWIGVGTWKIPNEIIPEQHQTAWRITRENLLRRSPVSLANLVEESRLGELRVLVYDVPLGVARGHDRRDETLRKNQMLALVHAYRGKLSSALDIYKRDGKEHTPEARRLQHTLDHLAHVVYVWLGDKPVGR